MTPDELHAPLMHEELLPGRLELGSECLDLVAELGSALNLRDEQEAHHDKSKREQAHQADDRDASSTRATRIRRCRLVLPGDGGAGGDGPQARGRSARSTGCA